MHIDAVVMMARLVDPAEARAREAIGADALPGRTFVVATAQRESGALRFSARIFWQRGWNCAPDNISGIIALKDYLCEA